MIVNNTTWVSQNPFNLGFILMLVSTLTIETGVIMFIAYRKGISYENCVDLGFAVVVANGITALLGIFILVFLGVS